MMNPQLENISKVWSSIKSVFSAAGAPVPHSQKEYQNLVDTLDCLIDEIGEDENHQFCAVMETISKLIENYEDQHFPTPQSSGIDALAYLMQEHNLKQSDLSELGSQGVVSEILAGKRALNIEQIKKVSERFHVSPMVFI
jgi:HTH-type transcriptional regulator/antitoxin HigA